MAKNPAHDIVIPDYFFNYGKLRDGTYGFKRVHYTKVICGDCDQKYNAETWSEDEDSDGDPMLVCECGGQIYSKVED